MSVRSVTNIEPTTQKTLLLQVDVSYYSWVMAPKRTSPKKVQMSKKEEKSLSSRSLANWKTQLNTKPWDPFFLNDIILSPYDHTHVMYILSHTHCGPDVIHRNKVSHETLSPRIFRY